MDDAPDLKSEAQRRRHPGLSIATAAGTLFVFDLGRNELLVFGRSGSEIVLNATDLKDLAFQLRQPRFARLLRRLIS